MPIGSEGPNTVAIGACAAESSLLTHQMYCDPTLSCASTNQLGARRRRRRRCADPRRRSGTASPDASQVQGPRRRAHRPSARPSTEWASAGTLPVLELRVPIRATRSRERDEVGRGEPVGKLASRPCDTVVGDPDHPWRRRVDGRQPEPVRPDQTVVGTRGDRRPAPRDLQRRAAEGTTGPSGVNVDANRIARRRHSRRGGAGGGQRDRGRRGSDRDRRRGRGRRR